MLGYMNNNVIRIISYMFEYRYTTKILSFLFIFLTSYPFTFISFFRFLSITKQYIDAIYFFVFLFFYCTALLYPRAHCPIKDIIFKLTRLTLSSVTC